MIKARSAIENTLCHESMNFLDLKDIIVAIIDDPDVDLGYEYVPQVDSSVFQIKEEDDILGDLFYTIKEETEESGTGTSDEAGTGWERNY